MDCGRELAGVSGTGTRGSLEKRREEEERVQNLSKFNHLAVVSQRRRQQQQTLSS